MVGAGSSTPTAASIRCARAANGHTVIADETNKFMPLHVRAHQK
jgi:hypothetical protein